MRVVNQLAASAIRIGVHFFQPASPTLSVLRNAALPSSN